MTEAARLIGCGVSTLGNYINGKTEAGEELLKKLSHFLKVDEAHIPRKLPEEEKARAAAPGASPPPISRVAAAEAIEWITRPLPDSAIQGSINRALSEGRRDIARLLLDVLDRRASSETDAIAGELLSGAVAEVVRPAPTPVRSPKAASTTGKISSPVAGAGKRSKARPSTPTPVLK